MGSQVTGFVMSKIMSDPLYEGSILRTLNSDPAFAQLDPAGRFDKFVNEVRGRQCDVYGDDTLLLHIRSGDSGWIAKTALGEEEGEAGEAGETVETGDPEAPGLGIIDDAAVQGILSYLQQTPSVRRVIMRRHASLRRAREGRRRPDRPE